MDQTHQSCYGLLFKHPFTLTDEEDSQVALWAGNFITMPMFLEHDGQQAHISVVIRYSHTSGHIMYL